LFIQAAALHDAAHGASLLLRGLEQGALLLLLCAAARSARADDPPPHTAPEVALLAGTEALIVVDTLQTFSL